MSSTCHFLELVLICIVVFFFFFFNDTATTEIYTLSLHDALPIWIRAIAGQQRLGHLDGDGMHIESLGSIDSLSRRQGDQMQILEWPQGPQVEDRAKVHVEPLGSLPGEHLDATRKTVNGLLSQILIVGG